MDGAQGGLQSTILGKWNDDILWPAQASAYSFLLYPSSSLLTIRLRLLVIAIAELNGGASSIQPIRGDSSRGLLWVTPAQKTYDQAWEQWTDECGGGIYWVRSSKLFSPIPLSLPILSSIPASGTTLIQSW